ncbi:hypothetical protein VYU27_007189 [Nannochloropsis oceanica]
MKLLLLPLLAATIAGLTQAQDIADTSASVNFPPSTVLNDDDTSAGSSLRGYGLKGFIVPAEHSKDPACGKPGCYYSVDCDEDNVCKSVCTGSGC